MPELKESPLPQIAVAGVIFLKKAFLIHLLSLIKPVNRIYIYLHEHTLIACRKCVKKHLRHTFTISITGTKIGKIR